VPSYVLRAAAGCAEPKTRPVPHERSLRRVWSPGNPGNLRVLRTHLMRLRRKLGEDGENPRCIFAEPRVGCWMPEGEEAAPGGEVQ